MTDQFTVTTAALQARFRPVFARIAEHAAARDHTRELAHDAVQWLRDAGFGALRVPVKYGGIGASVEQLFDLLTELATADANLTQILRGHFGFIDRLLLDKDVTDQAYWLPLAAQGALFGNATTEVNKQALGSVQTHVRKDAQGQWHLYGEKFYSTGTLYADWITVNAHRVVDGQEPELVIVVVPVSAKGVEIVDDWHGFGQRVTGSGTSRFHQVAVAEHQIIAHSHTRASALVAYFQLVHLATLTGIAYAIERDVTHYVQGRSHTFSHASAALPRHDPLVQQVVGQLSATAFVAHTAVRAVAHTFGDIARWRAAGNAITDEQLIDVELQAGKAQVGIVDPVLQAATRLFDVGGATALREDLRLDRHWRNARTLASHNPVIYKARSLGDNTLNNATPAFYWNVGVRQAA
jgi:alkylation response protein AidB-like acyl-CoA dehydrogenase